MPKPQHVVKAPLHQRRYAETRTAGVGGVGAALIAALHLSWPWATAIAAVIAGAPAVFTFLRGHGGIAGFLRDLWRGATK
jgi:hypothetical protein